MWEEVSPNIHFPGLLHYSIISICKFYQSMPVYTRHVYIGLHSTYSYTELPHECRSKLCRPMIVPRDSLSISSAWCMVLNLVKEVARSMHMTGWQVNPTYIYPHQYAIVFIQPLAPNLKATYAHSVYIHNARIATVTAISMQPLYTMDKSTYSETWLRQPPVGQF